MRYAMRSILGLILVGTLGLGACYDAEGDGDGAPADTGEQRTDTGGDANARDTIEGSCGAVPVCDPGDRQVEQCPDGGSCYTNSLCKYTITCLRGGGDDTGPSPTDAGEPDGGTDDGGTSDADGMCPDPSDWSGDVACPSVAVCCVNEVTGEKCWYSNPCTAPGDPGDDWTCGESQCSRDAGM